MIASRLKEHQARRTKHFGKLFRGLGVAMTVALSAGGLQAAPGVPAGSFWSAGPAGPVPAVDAGPAGQPARAGRLADVQGRVALFDTEQGQWTQALRNRPLAEGDRVSTERGAQAVVRVGSTEWRLGSSTEVQIVRLDQARMSFQLHRGSVALRVRSREMAEEVEVLTSEARLQPTRAGAYRLDREDDTTWVTVWRGASQVQTSDQTFPVLAGQRAELQAQGRGQGTMVTWSAPVQDRLADAVQSDDQRDDRSVSLQYVSPEMTGAEDLDRHGRWERHPEFGMVWSPLVVPSGWTPFSQGRWFWHVRWGWTWVDLAPWGFAPFHYGRWVLWGQRWVWAPGPRQVRPVFAPALVTVTGPSVGVSVVIGPSRPPPVWVPVVPRVPDRPWVGRHPHADGAFRGPYGGEHGRRLVPDGRGLWSWERERAEGR